MDQLSPDLWRPSSDDMIESRPSTSRKQSSRSLQPIGIIRLVEGNIYGPGGKPRPKDYILDRIFSMSRASRSRRRALGTFPTQRGGQSVIPAIWPTILPLDGFEWRNPPPTRRRRMWQHSSSAWPTRM